MVSPIVGTFGCRFIPFYHDGTETLILPALDGYLALHYHKAMPI